jgi:NhaP-type Na+/H+ or K+/H+ antiporter
MTVPEAAGAWSLTKDLLHQRLANGTDPVGDEVFAVCHGFTQWTPSTFMILLFPILAVLLAYAFKMVLDYYRLPLPYTFLLVVAGGVFGVAGCYLNLAQLSASLNYWVDVQNPEVLFYVLLPPLILESALFIDWWTVSNLLLQVFALSMILVIIDAALIAVFTTYVLTDAPWTLNAGWMFGALISPTDVLAVNMALEGSGVRTPLQVMIQGESLFNDGSGFTLFVLFLNRLRPDASQSIGQIFVQLFRLAGGGLALGIAFAMPTLLFLRRVWKDAAIEIGATFVISYLVFYVGESPCGVSGIVAVASFGLVLRADRFASLTPEFQESLLAFWSVISMIINAIAFTYAGFIAVVNLIVFWGRHGINGQTIGYGLALYPVLYLSRLVAVVVLYPVLRRSRYGLSWQEALLIVHAGLRGAISLIAAQIVFHEPGIVGGTYVNARVQLWTSTIVLMTLMLQAPTIKTVARWLGLLNRSAAQVRTFRTQVRRLHAKALDTMLEMRRTSRFTFADWVFVAQVAILPAELPKLLLSVGQVRNMVYQASRAQVLATHERPETSPTAMNGSDYLLLPGRNEQVATTAADGQLSRDDAPDHRASSRDQRAPVAGYQSTEASTAWLEGKDSASSTAESTWSGPLARAGPRLGSSLLRSASQPQLVTRPPRVSIALPRSSVDYRAVGPRALQERHSREMRRLSHSLQLERQQQQQQATRHQHRLRRWARRGFRARPHPQGPRGALRVERSDSSGFGRPSILQRRRQQAQIQRPRATTVFLHQLNESRRRALLAMHAAIQKQFLIGSMSMSPYRILSAAVDRSMDEVSNPTNIHEIRVFLHSQHGGWGLSRLERWLVSFCGRFRYLHRFARYLIYRRLFLGYDIVSGLTVALVHALHTRHEQQAERFATDTFERAGVPATSLPNSDWTRVDPHGSLTLVADMQVAIELEAEVARCETYLHSSRVLSPETVRASDSLHASTVLLSRQSRLIQDLYSTGALTEAEFKALLDQLDMRREALARVSIRFPLPTIADCLRSMLATWLEVEIPNQEALESALDQLLAAWRSAGQIRAFAFGDIVQRKDTLVEGVSYVVRGAIEVRTQHVDLVLDDDSPSSPATISSRMRQETSQLPPKTVPNRRMTSAERTRRQSAMIANLLSEEAFPIPGQAAAAAARTPATASESATSKPARSSAKHGFSWWWSGARSEATAPTSLPRNKSSPADSSESELSKEHQPQSMAARPLWNRRAAQERLRAFVGDVFGMKIHRAHRRAPDEEDEDADEAAWHEAAFSEDAPAAGLTMSVPEADLEASLSTTRALETSAHEVRTLSNSVTGQSYGMAGALYRHQSALELVVVSQLAHVFFIPATSFRSLMTSREDWHRLAMRMAASECARNLVPNLEEYLTETRMQYIETERRGQNSMEQTRTPSTSTAEAPVEEQAADQRQDTLGTETQRAASRPEPQAFSTAPSQRLPDASFLMYENHPSMAPDTMLFPPEALDYEKRRDAMLLPLRTATLVVWAMPRLRPGLLTGPLNGQCIARRLRSAIMVLLQGTVYLQTHDAEAARQLHHARPLCKQYGCLGRFHSDAHAPCETQPVRCRVLVVTPSDTPFFFHRASTADEAENEAIRSLLTPASNPALERTTERSTYTGLAWHPPDSDLVSSDGLLRRRVEAPALIRLDVVPLATAAAVPKATEAMDRDSLDRAAPEILSRQLSMATLTTTASRRGKRPASPLDLYSGERKANARTKLVGHASDQYTLVWFDAADPRLVDFVHAFGAGPGGHPDPLIEAVSRSRPLSSHVGEQSIAAPIESPETSLTATAPGETSMEGIPTRSLSVSASATGMGDVSDTFTRTVAERLPSSSDENSSPDLDADVQLMADRHLLS